MSESVTHLIFDVESVADGELIAKVRYPDESLTPDEAVAKYQAERLEQTGSTFIPHTFMVPIAVVIAKVDADYRLLDIVSLDEPHYRPHVITKHFWQGWQAYHQPQWVTFNGRSFDIPLMELSAFRFGHPIPQWFKGSGYQSPRNRFSTNAHLDLQELLTNFGAARFNGGLNLAAQMLGKPGKVGLKGDQVQAYFDAGDLKAISDYCRCDVLDTYFVFLRSMLVTGKVTLEQETTLVAQAKEWIEQQSTTCQACADYLAAWGEWHNPWEADAVGQSETTDDTSAPAPNNTLPVNTDSAAAAVETQTPVAKTSSKDNPRAGSDPGVATES